MSMSDEQLEQWRSAAIMHVDLDMFFVAVGLLERPDLVGKPVIVARDSGRSVVLSASYEARAFGVRSGMPVSRARAMCPQGILLDPSYADYPRYSEQVMAMFHDLTHLVEQISVDEAFLDVSGAIRRLGSPVHIARQLRARIHRETGLTASVGIGATKTVAKIASTRSKPDGLLLVRAEDTVAFMAELPVGALWGVGRRTEETLQRSGIRTVGEIAQRTPQQLARVVGPAAGAHLHALAHGVDPRPVTPEREEKSLGAEQTFQTDVSDIDALRRELLGLSHRTAARLRRHRLRARRVGLKLRWEDFTTISRSRTVSHPFTSGHDLYTHAEELLTAELPLPSAVRLIGVRAESLEDADSAMQLSIDGREEEWAAAESAMDRARERFGGAVLGPASMLRPPRGTVGRSELRAGPRDDPAPGGAGRARSQPRR
ncbi:DNA polymerase IV [Kocuria palustris]|uniref:DNA polymerase IV n=1 Tax=Kocuria palustris TaxID=71999 RepID=UPI003D720ADA